MITIGLLAAIAVLLVFGFARLHSLQKTQTELEQKLGKAREDRDTIEVERSEIDQNLKDSEDRLKQNDLVCAELVRKNKDYFSLLERLEKQREDWKKMWFEQVGQHQEAQAMLERALMTMRHYFVAATTELNAYRKEKGLPEVKNHTDLKAPPIGAADAYGSRMKQLEAAAPVDVDISAEVQKIG